MLGKLLKYEWKGTYKIVLILLLVLLGATLFASLGLVGLVKYMSGPSADGGEMGAVFATMFLFMTIGIYFISVIGISYTLQIYQGVHFYKTMYTDEGYLTHTLPVTANQILFSKTLMAGCWNLIVWFAMGISMVILMASLMFGLAEEMPGIRISDFREVFTEMKRELLESGTMFQIVHLVFSMIFAVLLAPFSTVMMIFGGLTIGQLARKYKALVGILAYVGILFVNSILGQILQFVFMMGAVAESAILDNPALYTTGNMDSTLVLSVIMTVGLYFMSHYIITKKLNLD